MWCDVVLECGVMTIKTMPYMCVASLKVVAAESSTQISLSIFLDRWRSVEPEKLLNYFRGLGPSERFVDTLGTRPNRELSLSLCTGPTRTSTLQRSRKCSYERPIRGTVCGTMRSMCGADAGCLAINYQSLLQRSQ